MRMEDLQKKLAAPDSNKLASTDTFIGGWLRMTQTRTHIIYKSHFRPWGSESNRVESNEETRWITSRRQKRKSENLPPLTFSLFLFTHPLISQQPWEWADEKLGCESRLVTMTWPRRLCKQFSLLSRETRSTHLRHDRDLSQSNICRRYLLVKFFVILV